MGEAVRKSRPGTLVAKVLPGAALGGETPGWTWPRDGLHRQTCSPAAFGCWLLGARKACAQGL